MKQLKLILFALLSLLVVSCGNDGNNEPEIAPIRFAQQDYTIRMGVTSFIDYYDGGGLYELSVGNPNVLGECSIDAANHRLSVSPKGMGESTLTVKDILANSSVTLKFTVTNFYLSFSIIEIEGANNNPCLNTDGEIRFIRNADNTKSVELFTLDHMTNKEALVGEGNFDMIRDGYIYKLRMDLQSPESDSFKSFEYRLGGDAEYLTIFNLYFDFGWDKQPQSKSLPAKQICMIMTDESNGCQITCKMLPLN